MHNGVCVWGGEVQGEAAGHVEKEEGELVEEGQAEETEEGEEEGRCQRRGSVSWMGGRSLLTDEDQQVNINVR